MSASATSTILDRLKHTDRSLAGRLMLLGAVTGFVVISLFVFGFEPDPAWGENWRIRPLVLTPLVAAFGMLAFLLKDLLRPVSAPRKFLVFLLSLTGFLIALWIGIVIGLDGTMWD